MTKLAFTGVLLGLLTACGDNSNDVGIFDDEAMGGTGQGDGASDASSAEGSDGTTTSDGAVGPSATSSGGGDPTSDSTSTSSDGSTGGSSGSTGTSSTAGGAGGAGAQAGEESTSGGSGGEALGGSGGSDTTGGAGGGSGGGNDETCPLERPTSNTVCDAVGVCDYGEGCVQDRLACEEGQWLEVAPEAQPTCADFGPGSYPENGQSCECLGELRCQFLDCEGRGAIRAACNEGSWQVEDSDCVSRPCAANGDGEDVAMCEPGEICVATSAGGPGVSYECQPNPCAEAKLQNSCECASTLCPDSDAVRCELQEEATVVACICDDCN